MKSDLDVLLVNRLGRAYGKWGIDAMMDRLEERVGFHVHAHGFRHTFATVATQMGWNLERVRAAMGHADYSVLQRYVCLSAERDLGPRPRGPNSSPCPERALREHQDGGGLKPQRMDHGMNGSECRIAPVIEHVAERRAVDMRSDGELLVRHVRDDSCTFDLANIECPSTGACRDFAGHRSRYRGPICCGNRQFGLDGLRAGFGHEASRRSSARHRFTVRPQATTERLQFRLAASLNAGGGDVDVRGDA